MVARSGCINVFVSFQAWVAVMVILHQHLLARTGIALIILALVPAVANAWSWQDLWKTPHQQRQALEQEGEYQALIDSDSPQWQGAGHYRAEDYAAAAESYAQTQEQSSLYNQATALTRAGEYDSAIELYDDLLSQNPEHTKAAHNQDIARQLKELQQSEQDQDQDQGEDQDQDSNQQQDQSEQQDQENQQSDSSEPQDDSSQADQQNENEDSESEENEQQQSEEEQSEAEQEQQEQQQQSEEEAQQEAAQSSAVESDEPLSEDQQAIEQWLRKIPDDPSGLLRRKLIRSHRSDYPDIRDSQSPW